MSHSDENPATPNAGKYSQLRAGPIATVQGAVADFRWRRINPDRGKRHWLRSIGEDCNRSHRGGGLMVAFANGRTPASAPTYPPRKGRPREPFLQAGGFPSSSRNGAYAESGTDAVRSRLDSGFHRNDEPALFLTTASNPAGECRSRFFHRSWVR